MSKIELYNIDCMEYLKTLEDNAYELAIVDPPYGINVKTRIFNDGKKWDNDIPKKEYFIELKRVSKNQIIWGGNYFLDYLGATSSFIIWDKMDTAINGNWRCELAWSSFKTTSYIYKTKRPGKSGFFTVDCARIHPTQKPVKLYEWLIMNYANKGDKILDTHLGSGSIAIACHNLNYDLVGCELDKDYYNAACKRLKQHQAQLTIF